MARVFTIPLFSLFILPFAQAAPSPTCTAVASVSGCVKSISSGFTNTKSRSSFCSSILKCTTTPTVTLTGTITSTISKFISHGFTDSEEAVTVTSFTTITYTVTTEVPTSTTTIYPTFPIEKFVITTIKPGKYKREEPHPKDIARRATTVCPTTAESSACSCLITCPTTVTKDNRKTSKTTETYEFDYYATTVYYTGTDTYYDATVATDTSLYLDTSTILATFTHTRTVKCTPSVPNSSFYLRATDAPEVNSRYLSYRPVLSEPQNRFLPILKRIDFTRYKDDAAVWHLTDGGKLSTPNLLGDLFVNTDYFSPDFEITGLLTRADIEYTQWLALTCTIMPPSGRFAGGFKELMCQANFGGPVDTPTNIFQYCSIYDHIAKYHAPVVIANDHNYGAELDPPCTNLTLLVVPVCG
ncbi:hypothetical protein H072_4077 [Dactylellina haptotyla CBS 200.50]|uniref:Uncharacterized protein n=1 Tax=Dactylellina haptotyla (strain CBS 200.50) TaxID=1284197 RepID=S8BR97_DACHA|nr:hypothetical protein H072_4077 [Dactylellina haptotyla CBS 200.50]